MKQKIRVVIVLKCKNIALVLGLFIPLINANTSQADTLKVCYDQWAPMTIFPTKDEPNRGVVIDMLEHIYTSKGYELEYYEVPLARGLDMVAEGLCDMLPEYLFSLSSANQFVYAAEPSFSYPTAFVVRRDDPWRYTDIYSIEGKRIATGPGWDYSSVSVDYQDYIDAPEHSGLVEVIAGTDDVVDRIFQMIKANRVDIYADNVLVLQHTLHRLNLQNDLRIISPGLENKLVEMPIFSKNIPKAKRLKLIQIWNEGRVAMKGEKETLLLQKYNVTFE
ncbi:MAG TPA: transporter substrate-binding domain-containing protein [Methylophaga aminisulfidivorans]|nr:transporter substrate-binding domain-containing protein [Methylophaga aminisulfidivorans]